MVFGDEGRHTRISGGLGVMTIFRLILDDIGLVEGNNVHCPSLRRDSGLLGIWDIGALADSLL